MEEHNDANFNNIGNENNKSLRKAMIFLLAAICLVGALIFGVTHFLSGSSKTSPKHLKYNTNKKFLEDRKIESLTFSDIECSYDGSDSGLTYTIINHSDTTVHLSEYEIVIKDEKGNVLATINPNYDYDLPAGEKFKTTNSVSVDLTKAVSLDINLHPSHPEGEQSEQSESE